MSDDRNDRSKAGAPEPLSLEPLSLEPSTRAPSPVAAPPTPDEDARKTAAARERILTSMRTRHAIGSSLAWALLLGGIMVVVFAGLVVSMILWFISAMLFEESIGVRTWFIIYLVAIVPLLIWEERRTRGGFFTLAVAEVDLTRDPDNTADYLLQRTQSHVVAFTEMLLWGPRALLAGFRALRGIRETGLDVVLPEAADTLTLMMSLDSGVKIKDLAAPGTDPMMLMPVLKWLDTHDYIGISSRGDRVWVSSVAKKQFAAQGIVVPKMKT